MLFRLIWVLGTLYSSLLEKSRQTTLHLKHIKIVALEVFKSLNKLNPAFM